MGMVRSDLTEMQAAELGSTTLTRAELFSTALEVFDKSILNRDISLTVTAYDAH